MKELHAQFKGIVQNVCFRAHIHKIASRKNISGYVKNLPDGSVELVAQGSLEALNDFLNEIKENPGNAIIDSVNTKFEESTELLTSFSIKYD